MQRKHMTREEVMQATREVLLRINTPEIKKKLEEEEKNSKFQLKVFGKDDLDYEEEIARERMNKEKK